MKESARLIHSQWQTVDLESSLFSALCELSPLAQRAINLRFWENFSIEEIATNLRLTWDQTDQLIEMSLEELRTRLTISGESLVLQEAG